MNSEEMEWERGRRRKKKENIIDGK